MAYNYLDKDGTSYDVGKTKTLINNTKTELQNRITIMQGRLDAMQTQLNELSSNIDWKEAVDTFADIATTYPNPQDGWTVNVKDTDYTYRYNGTEWVVISANAIPDATPFVKGLMTTNQVAKLNSLENYVLPTAKANELGGIKPDGVTLTVDMNGVAYARGEDKAVSALTDTQITNPQEGQILTWDSALGKWVNGEGGETVIKLDDVSGATVAQVTETESVSIIWSDPQDIVVSGITLAEWKGTRVVRKENSAPTAITDGTTVVDSRVRNQYSSTAFVDSTVEYGKTYYYRFFPYTTGAVITEGSSRNVTVALSSTEIPVQVGTLTYTGSSQSPTLSTNTGFTTSGDTSGTNAGSYELIATLEAGREWSDLTTEPKTVTWSIQKSNESAILSSENVLLEEDHLTATVTVSNLHDRVISSVESNDTSVATVALENGEIVIRHVNQTSGSTTVTVTIASNSNYNGCELTIAVTASFGPQSLNDTTWAEINAAALDGTASSLWNVGDRKAVELNGTLTTNVSFSHTTIYAYIIGFNHNASFEGDHTIHFQFGYSDLTGGVKVAIHDSTNQDIVMFQDANPTGTVNGWEYSYMRNTILPAFKNCLPNDLKSVLRTVNKWTDNKGGTNYVNPQDAFEDWVSTTVDDIFLLSSYELRGLTNFSTGNVPENEYEYINQMQYDYYVSGNDYIFYKYDNASDHLKYVWLRTLFYDKSKDGKEKYGTWFETIYYDNGTINTNNGRVRNNSYSIAPAFVVGKALE